jgi:DNA-binding MarR family transcriptional regulator
VFSNLDEAGAVIAAQVRAAVAADVAADAGAAGDLLADATVIRRGATSLAARARSERRGELTLNQTAVLGLLVKRGPMTPSEVAERLNASLQSLTRTFASLESEEWMHRAVDPSDRRQSILSISAEGRRAIRREMRPRDVWLAQAVARELTDAERALLVRASALLERLADVDASPAPVEP